jgi:hypothetical protein
LTSVERPESQGEVERKNVNKKKSSSRVLSQKHSSIALAKQKQEIIDNIEQDE